MSLSRRLVAEGLGTALLLVVIVGSGIMGENLAGGNVGLALLANSIATGLGISVLILVFGPVSGAHFNPVVTLVDIIQNGTTWSTAFLYVVVQILGAFAGVAATHLMFGEALFSISTHARTGVGLWWSEVVATFGLLTVILGCSRSQPASMPFAVGAYIAAAYWFTSSTSLANPAVTLARSVTDTFTGIRPGDTSYFIAAQLLGGLCAGALALWLFTPSLQEQRKYL